MLPYPKGFGSLCLLSEGRNPHTKDAGMSEQSGFVCLNCKARRPPIPDFDNEWRKRARRDGPAESKARRVTRLSVREAKVGMFYDSGVWCATET
jgi:hypothetical protein